MLKSDINIATAVLAARVEPGDWDWTAIGSIATAVAALVTAATIVFIFFQTRATAKAAKEAERTADAAFKALDYSQKQLDFAQRQHLQAMYMAAEAVKSRIDADLPKLVLEKVEVGTTHNIDGGERIPDALFEPGDSNREISHNVKFQIKNDGPRSAKLLCSEQIKYHMVSAEGFDSIQQIEEADEGIPLGTGQTLHGEYKVRRTVGDWINIAKAREGGEDHEGHKFWIRSLTDADTGAHETHEISFTGEALIQDPMQLGRWAPIPTNEVRSKMVAFVEPVRRFYFISRVRNEELPDIPWTSFSEMPKS